MEVTITTENFESYKNGELPLVVDLWATWCGPCRQIAPIVSELAEEFDGKLVVGKCDVEENDDIAMEFGVRNIPTILFFKGGQLVDKFVGAALRQPSLRSSRLSCNQARIGNDKSIWLEKKYSQPDAFFCSGLSVTYHSTLLVPSSSTVIVTLVQSSGSRSSISSGHSRKQRLPL